VLLWVMQISTLLILVLAANTAFSGFPRLAAMLADDQCLPRQMRWVGDRLVHQNGIGVLLGVTALIIFICRGDTTVAVNLYALGVFTAFTLSQLGLVKRWWQRHGNGWQGRLLMNALGAVATFVVLLVIVVSKFDEGAWTVVIAIPLLIWALTRIRERYRALYSAMALPVDFVLPRMEPHHPLIGNRCVVWVPRISRPTMQAVRYACSIADQVVAVAVLERPENESAAQEQWKRLVGEGPMVPQLVLLQSPYSSLIDPFRQYVMEQEHAAPPGVSVTVVIPVAIPRDRFDKLLLNQRANVLYEALADDRSRVFSVVRSFIA
jgi:hypothetical protein